MLQRKNIHTTINTHKTSISYFSHKLMFIIVKQHIKKTYEKCFDEPNVWLLICKSIILHSCNLLNTKYQNWTFLLQKLFSKH